jgi:integrase
VAVKVKFWKRAWWVFVHQQGRRKVKRVGDRETALRVAQAIREKLLRGELQLAPSAEVQTFRSYSEAWLKTVTGSLKGSTVTFYKGALGTHIWPSLGSRAVTSIRRRDCRDLIGECRGKGLRIATVKGILRALSTVLSQAVEDELLMANPALRMGKYLRQGDEPKREIQPLARPEIVHLLAAAKEHFPRWHPLLLCAVRTGLRQGELLGLRWADIDFTGRFIAVNQNRVRGTITTPKNHQRRRVDMSAQLAEVLAAERLRQRQHALKTGTASPEAVFPSADGTMLDEANVRHMFYRILEKAQLRRVRFHDLRHTFATLLILQGESLAYVRDQLGHRSIQVTVDIYGHAVPGGNRAAVDRLDDAPLAAPNVTPAAPAGGADDQTNVLSALNGMVSREGIEPSTRRLRVCCSAN